MRDYIGEALLYGFIFFCIVGIMGCASEPNVEDLLNKPSDRKSACMKELPSCPAGLVLVTESSGNCTFRASCVRRIAW